MRSRLKYLVALVATLFVFQAKASFADVNITAPAPANVDFGQVAVGDTATQVYSVEVLGLDRLTAVVVTDNVNYTIIADTCTGLGAPPNGTCSFTVQFNPTVVGVIPQAQVRISAAFDIVTATLDGEGAANPVADVNPTALNFSAPLGGVSVPQAAQLTNNGSTELTVSAVTITTGTDFSISSNTCDGAVLAPGSSCLVEVVCEPASLTVAADTLSFASDDPSSPTDVTLNCTAFDGPFLTVLPGVLVFGDVGVGNTSSELILEVQNTGTDSVGNVDVPTPTAPEFTKIQDNCSGEDLSPGQTCVVQFTFSPTAVATVTETLAVTGDDGGGGLSVDFDLTGNGVEDPIAAANPSALDFGQVALGHTSSSQLVQVSNAGSTALDISAATLASGTDFVVTGNTCDSASLQPGDGCVVAVACRPSATGTLPTDTLDIASNDPASPLSVTLDCEGIGGPNAVVDPDILDFGQVGIGNSSGMFTVLLSNNGTDDLTINANPVLTGSSAAEFAIQNIGNACPAGLVLTPGESCVVQLVYTPVDLGIDNNAALEFDTDGGTPQVGLVGEGIEGPAISVNPDPMTFPNSQAVGTTSAPRLIVVTNVGTDVVTNLAVGALDDDTDFDLTQDTCTGTDLAPAASCIVTAVFHPTATGALSTFFTITADDGISEQVDLNGTGVQATIDITGTTAFGNVNVGSTSTETLTVTNNGDAPVSLAAVKQTGDNPEQFIVSDDTCSYAVLDPSESCAFDVTFRPLAGGAFVDTIAVASTSNEVSTVGLTGTGIVPTPPGVGLLQIKTDVLDFDLEIGQNATQSTTITNIGDANVSINSLVLDGDTNFTQTNDCDGQTLAAGDSCSVAVTFTAGSTNGNFSAVVSIDSNPASTDFLVLLGSALTDDDTIDGGGCSLASASSGLPIGAAWLWMAPVAVMAWLRSRRQR